MKTIQAQPQHIDLVRELFREYQAWLNADCCFQGFEQELASLPGNYAAPNGAIYLVFDKENAVACSAIRARSDKPETDAELKRLFVKEEYRGHGLGKDIFNTSMVGAKEMGYEAVVLETLPEKMKVAQVLYKEYGFKAIPTYSVNADIGVECYRYCFE